MENVTDIYALSPMQKLMLLHAKTAGSGHDVLFNQIVYTISGSIDIPAYQRAWQLMIDRHPALRTLFIWQDQQEPLQVVREQLPLPWTEHDWRSQGSEDQETALDELLAADRRKGFDLLRPPLMRLILIRRTEIDYWLIWSSHHLIIDRWCIGILFAEVKSAYEAALANAHPALPPAPRYRDYIAWLAEQDEQKSMRFWQEALQDVAARSLPLTPTAGTGNQRLANRRIQLDSAAFATLRDFAIANNLTINSLVTAAWAIVLAAVTKADDVLFGLTVSGRPTELADIGRTVGCFINNVPLRLTLDEDLPLISWLKLVQERQLGLGPFEHDSPAQIQEWSGSHLRSPFFDTLVVFQAPVQTAVPAGLDLQFDRGGMQTGFPITLAAVPGQEKLRLTLTYEEREVPQRMVDQIATSLQQLLHTLPKSSAAALSTLRSTISIDPALESARVASAWNSSAAHPYVPPRSATEQALAQIWTEVLDLPRVSIDDKFFALGGDSINAVHLFTRIEQQLGQKLPLTLLFSNPTVAEMAAAIHDDSLHLPSDPILLPINQDGTRPPFFYAHGVFGDISSLTNIVPLLPAEQPLYGLQAIGLHPDHEPDRSLEEMAAHYLEAVRRVQPSGPYYLGGFCFGGVLAYELARQLEEEGEEIGLLAIIEGSAPREYHQSKPLFHPQRLRVIRHSAPQILSGNQEFGGWSLRERIRERFGQVSAVQNVVNGRDAWDIEFDNLADFNASRPEIQQQLRAVNVAAINQYRPRPFKGRVTLFRARYLPARHTFLGKIDPQRGWGSLAQGGVELRYVDGTHIGILRQPNAARLAAALTQALEEATP